MKNQKSFVILGIVLILLVMLSVFVSAASFSDLFGSGATGIWSSWQGGQLNLNLAKIMLAVIILIFVFAIIRLIPGIKKLNGFLKFVLAAVVTFLATSYFTPSEIYTIISQYSGLGFAMGVGLPFIILAGFTLQSLADMPETAFDLFMAKTMITILWLGFSAFLFYRWTSGPSDALQNVQLVLAIVSGVIGLGINFVSGFIAKKMDDTTKSLAKRKADMAVAGVNTMAGVEESIANGSGSP